MIGKIVCTRKRMNCCTNEHENRTNARTDHENNRTQVRLNKIKINKNNQTAERKNTYATNRTKINSRTQEQQYPTEHKKHHIARTTTNPHPAHQTIRNTKGKPPMGKPPRGNRRGETTEGKAEAPS